MDDYTGIQLIQDYFELFKLKKQCQVVKGLLFKHNDIEELTVLMSQVFN